MRTCAIIPARGGSKAIPHKNIIDFCGKPLIVWSIEQALASRWVDEVYVSSDSEKILKIAKKAGAIPIRRPEMLARDRSSTEDALLHALGYLEPLSPKPVDALVLLQPTSPLRQGFDLDRAIKVFRKEKADSLFSAVSLDDICLWKKAGGALTSVTYDHKKRGRRQDREPFFLENGSIYVFRPEVLKQHHNRMGGRMGIYKMSSWQSFEIDVPDDIGTCEYFMKTRLIHEL